MNGLELQERMSEAGISLPVEIFRIGTQLVGARAKY